MIRSSWAAVWFTPLPTIAQDRRDSACRWAASAIAGRRAEDLVHRRGELTQRREQFTAVGPIGDAVGAELGRQSEREQHTRGQLRVERLGGRDAHLDVTTVGCVEHAVALVDEIALPPVDDGNHDGATRAHEIDGAVRVGRGSRLRDRDDDRVAHVGRQLEARQLGRGQRLDGNRTVPERLPKHAGQALTGDVRTPLADHEHAANRAGVQSLEHHG